MVKIISNSAQETKLFAGKVSDILERKDIILLEGGLGAGKTTFVQGLAESFGYKGQVLSPSFTLVRKYPVRNLDIYHLDLYRLKKGSFSSIDLEGYLYSEKGLAVIEWGEKLAGLIERFLKISFFSLGINKRKLSISNKGYGKNKLKGLL